VVKTSEVVAFINSLKPGMFELPRGSAQRAPGAREKMAARG